MTELKLQYVYIAVHTYIHTYCNFSIHVYIYMYIYTYIHTIGTASRQIKIITNKNVNVSQYENIRYNINQAISDV